MIFRSLILALLTFSASCEEGNTSLRKSRPSEDGADVTGFEAQSTKTVKAGQPLTITLGRSSLNVPEGATNEDAEVRLRVLKSAPQRDELVSLGAPKSEVVEITFYEKTSKKIFSSSLFSEPYQLTQVLNDVDDGDTINYVFITSANTDEEKIQILGRNAFNTSEAALSLAALKVTLNLKVANAIVSAVTGEVPANIITIGNSTEIESAGGSVVADETAGSAQEEATPAVTLSDEWGPMNADGAPSARYFHTAVWTGSKMIIWGGIDTSADTNTGGIYDPVSDTWTPTTIDANTPAARFRHVAVWMGSKMLVSGGHFCCGEFDDAALFDPEQNKWLPTSTTTFLASYSSVVWTGEEAIIWGGSTGQGQDPISGGIIFNPSTGIKSMNIIDEQLTRTDHSAIWTGTEMIIWGGMSKADTEWTATGSRYDPQENTWTATPTEFAPPERQGHTAVWTGDAMIVWGGFDSSGAVLGNGGKLTGSLWTEMPPENEPSPRSGHTVVWTGSEMLIFGGADDLFQSTNTGGIYNDADESWREMPTNGGPSARRFHTAVWTGTQMIVWGGLSGATKFGDGAIFK